MLMEKVGHVSKAVIDGGLVANHTHARTVQQVNLFRKQSFDAKFDRLSILRHFSFRLSAQNRPAVHVENFTVDVPRPFGAKENDRPGYIFRSGYATNRNRIFDRLAE